jgi:splicing factor 3B subunit 1
MATPMRMTAETPTPGQSRFGATPTGAAATRWDQKPGQTPVGGLMQTPLQGYNPLMTPTAGVGSQPYWQKDLYDRNKPLTDEELDQLIPSQGYEVSAFRFPGSFFTLLTQPRTDTTLEIEAFSLKSLSLSH